MSERKVKQQVFPTKQFQASTVVAYSPQKTRLIINPIRGVVLSEAMDWLRFLKKGQNKKIHDLLKSAATNLNLTEADYANYKISQIMAEEAQTYLRYKPRARGMVGKIRRRYSRVKVALEPRN